MERVAAEKSVHFHCIKKSSGRNTNNLFDGQFIRSRNKTKNIRLEANLFAGTKLTFVAVVVFLVPPLLLPYLFIDEAEQVTTANGVAMATATKNIILVGKQMQLGPTSQGTYRGYTGWLDTE